MVSEMDFVPWNYGDPEMRWISVPVLVEQVSAMLLTPVVECTHPRATLDRSAGISNLRCSNCWAHAAGMISADEEFVRGFLMGGMRPIRREGMPADWTERTWRAIEKLLDAHVQFAEAHKRVVEVLGWTG